MILPLIVCALAGAILSPIAILLVLSRHFKAHNERKARTPFVVDVTFKGREADGFRILASLKEWRETSGAEFHIRTLTGMFDDVAEKTVAIGFPGEDHADHFRAWHSEQSA